MGELPAARPFVHYKPTPPTTRDGQPKGVWESATVGYIVETLSTHAEIAAVGRERFNGTLKQRNAVWREYRNYIRQALSNFSAAQSVPNRSAGLLYYYAALNFAKAELLDTHASHLVNRRVGHGLSFNPTNARSVSGDTLTVNDGIFRLLYERRVGEQVAPGTKLPVKRLLQQIPEVGSQVRTVGLGGSRTPGLYQAFVSDATQSWLVWALPYYPEADNTRDSTQKLIAQHFNHVLPPARWQSVFGLGARYHAPSVAFYETVSTIPAANDGYYVRETLDLAKPLRPILGMSTTEAFDAWLAPSLYKSRMLPMPPSLARYALTFYASSLLRYKPQMFDAQTFPEQAYLFDAIAREMALPLLQDVLAAALGVDVRFTGSSMRG